MTPTAVDVVLCTVHVFYIHTDTNYCVQNKFMNIKIMHSKFRVNLHFQEETHISYYLSMAPTAVDVV